MPPMIMVSTPSTAAGSENRTSIRTDMEKNA
jgi:hypothetical protein